MTDAAPLAGADLDRALLDLPGWHVDGDAITATFQMPTFPVAIDLVTRTAVSAEAANHHPDIDVRWRSVTFRLSTHEVGAITGRDLNLARRISAHAEALREE